MHTYTHLGVFFFYEEIENVLSTSLSSAPSHPPLLTCPHQHQPLLPPGIRIPIAKEYHSMQW